MAHKAPPELELKDAAIRRGDHIILRHLSFQISAGGRLWLRGGNGAGKSTLMRMIAGFLPLAAGDLLLGGKPFQPGRDLQLPIQFIGHDNGLSLVLSGRKNLEQATALIGAEMPESDNFNIQSFIDRPVRSLSAGQMQRIALTRLCASASDSLWLLDEPDTALDTDNRAALFSLIDQHCERGGRVILATHRPPEAADAWTQFYFDTKGTAAQSYMGTDA